MSQGSINISADRCPRCYQPVPPTALRCPHCGEKATRGTRKISLILGSCGLLLLVIVAGLAFYFNSNPPSEDSPDDAPAAQPAPPVKPPALDR
jgi:hypothetical protein